MNQSDLARTRIQGAARPAGALRRCIRAAGWWLPGWPAFLLLLAVTLEAFLRGFAAIDTTALELTALLVVPATFLCLIASGILPGRSPSRRPVLLLAAVAVGVWCAAVDTMHLPDQKLKEAGFRLRLNTSCDLGQLQSWAVRELDQSKPGDHDLPMPAFMEPLAKVYHFGPPSLHNGGPGDRYVTFSGSTSADLFDDSDWDLTIGAPSYRTRTGDWKDENDWLCDGHTFRLRNGIYASFDTDPF